MTEKDVRVGMPVEVTTNTGKKFQVKARLDTEVEVQYF